MTTRIAMWSGPRNISTALMRSWENRPDCEVTDEPLYAHYLLKTGLAHPGADEVIASQSTSWEEVTTALGGTPPEGSPVWYQKHMTHHMLPEVGREWLGRVLNVFLIRDPLEVAASYAKSRAEVSLRDLGLPQQWELFEHVTEHLGQPAVVIESRDVLDEPRGMLEALCAALGVPFVEAMLSWPAGPRASDGVWAPHWYDSVLASTGFQPYRPRPLDASPALHRIAEEGRPFYERLHSLRLRPSGGGGSA